MPWMQQGNGTVPGLAWAVFTPGQPKKSTPLLHSPHLPKRGQETSFRKREGGHPQGQLALLFLSPNRVHAAGKLSLGHFTLSPGEQGRPPRGRDGAGEAASRQDLQRQARARLSTLTFPQQLRKQESQERRGAGRARETARIKNPFLLPNKRPGVSTNRLLF